MLDRSGVYLPTSEVVIVVGSSHASWWSQQWGSIFRQLINRPHEESKWHTAKYHDDIAQIMTKGVCIRQMKVNQN